MLSPLWYSNLSFIPFSLTLFLTRCYLLYGIQICLLSLFDILLYYHSILFNTEVVFNSLDQQYGTNHCLYVLLLFEFYLVVKQVKGE